MTVTGTVSSNLNRRRIWSFIVDVGRLCLRVIFPAGYYERRPGGRNNRSEIRTNGNRTEQMEIDPNKNGNRSEHMEIDPKKWKSIRTNGNRPEHRMNYTEHVVEIGPNKWKSNRTKLEIDPNLET